jgi:hypothetical protein
LEIFTFKTADNDDTDKRNSHAKSFPHFEMIKISIPLFRASTQFRETSKGRRKTSEEDSKQEMEREREREGIFDRRALKSN